MAAATTGSLPAFKAYIGGEDAYREGRYPEGRPAAAGQCDRDSQQVKGEDIWRVAIAGQQQESGCQGDCNADLRGAGQLISPATRKELVQDDDDDDRQPAKAEDGGLPIAKCVRQPDPDDAHPLLHERGS